MGKVIHDFRDVLPDALCYVFDNNSTDRTAEVAAEAGADGLCVPPQSYLLNATRAEVAGRYEAIAKAVPLPIMVYNNPARTGVNVTPEILAAICDVAPVVAVNPASRR